MKYQVLKPMKVMTSKGEREIEAGQIVELEKDKAIPLLEKGKIVPVEQVAYKIYSELLGCYLWVIETDRDLADIQADEAFYTKDEIRKLHGIDKNTLKVIHEAKAMLNGTIERVKPCPKGQRGGN